MAGYCKKHWLATAMMGMTLLASTLAVVVHFMTIKERLAFGDVPPAELMGWASEEVPAAWEQVKGKFPEFRIVGALESSENKVVKLWDAAKAINNGRHFPTERQEIGDCVSFGFKHAIRYLQAAAQVENRGTEYHRLFAPYHYAMGRVAIGGNRIRGPDGSVGSWQAAAVKEFGVIRADMDGLPGYSAAVARQWATRRPDQKYIDAGKQHLIGDAALVRSYKDVRDALANGYPVAVCSNQGFQMRPRVDGGKHWGVPSGQWAHCMAFIGLDDTVQSPSWSGGGKGAVYCLNSWGPDAHGAPADDAPPGGFWVSSNVVDRMVKQADSFALSNFKGFPAQDLPWIIPVGKRRENAHERVKMAILAVAL